MAKDYSILTTLAAYLLGSLITTVILCLGSQYQVWVGRNCLCLIYWYVLRAQPHHWHTLAAQWWLVCWMDLCTLAWFNSPHKISIIFPHFSSDKKTMHLSQLVGITSPFYRLGNRGSEKWNDSPVDTSLRSTMQGFVYECCSVCSCKDSACYAEETHWVIFCFLNKLNSTELGFRPWMVPLHHNVPPWVWFCTLILTSLDLDLNIWCF